MREPERIERIINLIKKIWEKHPDLRFMQIIHDLSWLYNNDHNDIFKKCAYSKQEIGDAIVFNKDVIFVDSYYLEDDELEKYLEERLKKEW